MNKYIVGAVSFVGAIILGFVFFASTFEYQQKRSTASVKGDYDLSCLSGEELNKAIVNRIVLGLKGVRKDGYMGINIGHYTYSESKIENKEACANYKDRKISSTFSANPKKMACETYPKIVLSFVADGEADSGNKRQMDVITPCSVSADLSRTETAWIPWKQLALETPFEGLSEYNVPSKVSVKTQNITDKWPEKWVLDKIQMEGEAGTISVDASQIREVAGRPIIFEFN